MTALVRGMLVISGAVLLLPAAGACGRASKPAPLADITSESEEGGYHDLVFAIRDHKVSRDGGQSLHAAGLYQGQVVGFELYLGPAWKKGSLGSDIPIATYSGVVEFRSLGEESDGLIRTIDAVYETHAGASRMTPRATFTGISLEGNPARLADGVVKIKLFFEPGPEEGYAELFTDIDLGSGKIEVNEKDEEYRLPIVKALTAAAGA